jgi:hypothetical protein
MLDKRAFQEALVTFAEAEENGVELPPLGIFTRACAHAGLGEKATAFKWLNRAINQVWKALDFSKDRPEFQRWHNSPEWQAAVKRMTG